MEKINGGQREILCWAKNLEECTSAQAINLAELPMLVGHIALMPDAHLGMGMPIGGVIALKDAVVPNSVGVDCGCGVLSCETTCKETLSKEILEEIVHSIQRSIPMGFRHNQEPCEDGEMPEIKYDDCSYEENPNGVKATNVSDFLLTLYKDAKYALGSCGGGNHFIELQTDETNTLHIMIHSGSRNLGKKVCDHYNKLAEEFHTLWHIQHPEKLAWLPTDSEEGMNYIMDMKYCVEFAYRNRKKMLDVIKSQLKYILNKHKIEIDFLSELNIHHNYANLEHHFGQDVWVHRKGAIQAYKDQLGIIPGSMGTNSYIVMGLGNPASFCSSSHGSGRISSRTKYNETHTLEQAEKELENVVHSKFEKNRRGIMDISEAPSAYKDIEEVMANQTDLVKIVKTLTPIACIKG